MHLDIKPENIVFQAKDSQSMLKILDFGTSEIRKKKIDLFEIVETCGYMPPEVLKGKASYKSDI